MTIEKDCALVGRQVAITGDRLGECYHSSVMNQLKWG